MKISEFVRLTISEICDGIMNAADDVAQKTKNHPIAPAVADDKEGNPQRWKNIDFEILVSVSENSSSDSGVDGSARISVLSLGGNKSSKKEEAQERSAKINFSVPILITAVKKPNNNNPKT